MFAQLGFIQNFSVGVGKKHVHRATPSRGVWGDAPPGIFRNLHALRLLLGLQNGWKLATNELVSIKKKSQLQNSGVETHAGGGGGGDPSAPPLCMTPCTVQVMPRP